MSLYADYIKERLGDGIIERPEGFASYRFLNEGKSVYILDIYVSPSYRKTNVASKMADEIAAIGKERGATELVGTVTPSANNSTQSLSVLLAYGMKLKCLGNDLIVFTKEIT